MNGWSNPAPGADKECWCQQDVKPTPAPQAEAGIPYAAIETIVKERCQPCHASTSPNRYGAPEDVFFDTHEDVMERKDQILEQATGEDPYMPPQGGVTENDLFLLETWLTCWE